MTAITTSSSTRLKPCRCLTTQRALTIWRALTTSIHPCPLPIDLSVSRSVLVPATSCEPLSPYEMLDDSTTIAL